MPSARDAVIIERMRELLALFGEGQRQAKAANRKDDRARFIFAQERVRALIEEVER